LAGPSRLDPGQRRVIAERYAAGATMAGANLDQLICVTTYWRTAPQAGILAKLSFDEDQRSGY
jgi:hypothetical protein